MVHCGREAMSPRRAKLAHDVTCKPLRQPICDSAHRAAYTYTYMIERRNKNKPPGHRAS